TSCQLSGNCGDSIYDYAASMAEVRNIIQANYVPNNIQLHTILIGDHVRPHTLLRKGSDESAGRCLTPDEAAKLNASYTKSCPVCANIDSCQSCPPPGSSSADQDYLNTALKNIYSDVAAEFP